MKIIVKGCDACGSTTASLLSYRGYEICDYCRRAWGILMNEIGRATTWDEFCKPQPKIFLRR